MTRRQQASNKRRVFVRRYKTTMCETFVASGQCPFGFDCLFAHTESELRTEEMNIAQGVTDSVIAMWVAKKKRDSARTSDVSSTAPEPTNDSFQSAVDALRQSHPPSTAQAGQALRQLWRVASADGQALQRIAQRRARNQEAVIAPRSNPYAAGGAAPCDCWAMVDSDPDPF